LHWDSLCLGREVWLRNHCRWLEIPYHNVQHHVGKGKHCGYLEILYSRWGVEEGNLSNGLGDCLPNQDLTLGEGDIKDKWCHMVLRGILS
jgi:hypothetical protein